MRVHGLVTSVRAATPCHVLGLPSLSSCHTGCCGLPLDLLPVRSFISPELLAMGHVLGMLEGPDLSHCTDAASEAPALWCRHGRGGCARFIAWITGMPSEMAAERDGVFAFCPCCWPETRWSTQGSKAGEVTAVPVPGPCAGASMHCRAQPGRQSLGMCIVGGSQGAPPAEFGLCLLTLQHLLVPQVLVPQGAAEAWMQQERAGLILDASTPCPLQPGIPYLLPACSPPAPCLLQPGDLQCRESDCSGFDSLL